MSDQWQSDGVRENGWGDEPPMLGSGVDDDLEDVEDDGWGDEDDE